jgi:hypothetical protein
MHCFNHQELEAVGTCKQCSKGLCSECATDLGHGLACRGVHEQAVEAINTLMVRSNRIQRMAPRTQYIVPAFMGFMGIAFGGYGLFGLRHPDPFLIILGAGFATYAAVLLVANRKAFRSGGTQA